MQILRRQARIGIAVGVVGFVLVFRGLPRAERRPATRRTSIAVQRSITTASPASAAIAAASQLTIPSWSHRQRAPMATASRMRHHELRSAEDVDEVERASCGDRRLQRRECRNPEHALFLRVDRHAVVTTLDEELEHTVRRPSRF